MGDSYEGLAEYLDEMVRFQGFLGVVVGLGVVLVRRLMPGTRVSDNRYYVKPRLRRFPR